MSTEATTPLQRRRELKRLHKPQLIDKIIELEDSIKIATAAIERVSKDLS